MLGKGLPAKTEVVGGKSQATYVPTGTLSEAQPLATIRVSTTKEGSAPLKGATLPLKTESKSTTHSPTQSRHHSLSPAGHTAETEQTIGADISVKMEPGQPLKLARTSSQKVMTRPTRLFDNLPDMTADAKNTFQVISQCIYAAKYLGTTEHAMECDCAEEWDASTKSNLACGDDSDCINRLTKMECFGDCGCGSHCQNQRFQRQRYANVTVIKTEKKGYGLRAETDLNPHDFIFEYIGEVINEVQFRRRMLHYDEEGIKHFYFMSLSKGEFVDATKKGNLGRFCNHSCNPNCYVDKWVVGDKLRMGIFAERKIKAGEELVFNYNVDRYGADPQPCYCGEPNCTGFIGGKTQTERATKLSHTTIEALGIDDGDGWDTAVAKRPRKKKSGEDDEEYVNNVQPKSLDEDGVTKVMATLLQCKEKWIAVKLLGRIQRCEDERVRNRVVKMHGYQILNSALTTWKEDFNVVLQIMDILNKFHRLTRNKISDSKIEVAVEELTTCGEWRVETQAAALLKEWSTLEVAYRIPRKKRDPNSTTTDRPDRFDRRESARVDRKERSRSPTRSRSDSIDIPRGPSAPTGPRNNQPQRKAGYYNGARPPYRRPYNPLPAGWFAAIANGNTYYYSAAGQTTWVRPTVPAAQPPPPPKPASRDKALDAIINSIISEKENTPKEKPSATATPQPAAEQPIDDKKHGKEKWKSFSEDKKKKLYEHTIFPPIKYVVDKFKTKLPRDDLKRFAKDIAKKLVNSDFKNNRVEDPTSISSRQEKNVKKYVKDFFDKAVIKRREYEKKKAERKMKDGGSATSPPIATPTVDDAVKDEPQSSGAVTPASGSGSGSGSASASVSGENLKRKRADEDESDGTKAQAVDATANKKVKLETPPPPPPPPPPPAEDMPANDPMVDAPEEIINTEDVSSGLLGEGASLSTEQDEAMEDISAITPPSAPTINGAVGIFTADSDQTGGHHNPMENHSPLTPGPNQEYMLDNAVRKHGGMKLAMS